MITGVLLDLGGVVFTGDEALPGSVAAVGRLRASGLPLRFATNVTTRPRRALVAELKGLGLEVSEADVFMPGIAARDYLAERGLTPYLLVSPALEEDFDGLPTGEPDAVVIGDARERISYESLNTAFRLVMEGAPLIALAGNRHFRDADGELSLDAGAFVETLEYATGQEAVMLGKPARGFFEAAAASMDSPVETTVMVGDDAEFDVAAARQAGFMGVLVRTGKYRPGAESEVYPRPSAVVDDLAAAADWILAHRE